MSTSNLIISNRKTDIERNGQNSEVQAFVNKNVMKYKRDASDESRRGRGGGVAQGLIMCDGTDWAEMRE